MVQFNTKDNEILVKIVFYGPGLSGKTTNLQKLHELTDTGQKTDLFSVNTMEDRTLFFDLLPLDLGSIYGNSIKLQIYTVPGQVHYDSTRRIVLSGADGIVFVADSQKDKLKENIQSINNLYHNLQANRLNIKEIPLVLQFNKRDLDNIHTEEHLNQKLNFRNVPTFSAVAIQGEGVLETFVETVKITVRYIFNKYQLSKNVKNIESLIEKLEHSLRVKTEPVDTDVDDGNDTASTKPIPVEDKRTVLRYVHEHDPDDAKQSQDDLLKQALASNMETAQLYTKLKKSQQALVEKNEQLEKVTKKLEKSNNDNLKMRRYLESLVNFAGDAIMTFNESWVIQNWNQSAEELFGYQREEVLNRKVDMFFPDEALDDLNKVLSYVTKGKIVRGFDTHLKAKSGAVLPVSITFSPIKNQTGKIVAFTAMARDMSFLERSAAQLFQLQRFEAAAALLPMFISRLKANVSNIPSGLNAMMGNLGRLVSADENEAEATDLNDLIRNAYVLVEPRFKRQGTGFATKLYNGLPALMMNRLQMARAFLNLFLNALEATAGDEGAKVTIGTHFANGEVLMQMIDNGRGFDVALLDKPPEGSLTDPLPRMILRYTAVRDIVHRHDGHIRIDSVANRGTKTTIRFKVM